ncbi:MAG: phosphatase PAP2 family protein [Prevotella sp.]|nr:phosphatase PAP2 family protein [Prevotella sp.]
MKAFKYLFEIEKKPRKGLLTIEWVAIGYTVLTTLFILFAYTKMYNPEPMLWGRLRILLTTAALWLVYRLVPCRFTHFCRPVVQLCLLGWWYPDTYELNRIFPCFDHYFVAIEQRLFGCQPALLFPQLCTSPVLSELFHMGYGSYYFLMVVVTCYYFAFRYAEFNRATFVIFSSFIAYYLIFIFLPVVGPQYYYMAVGTDQIAQGVFPDLGHYFATHQESLPIPGYQDGFFYQFVVDAHNAGERPTAAFPSSHVGVTTVLLLLAWHSRSRLLFWLIVPFYVLMFFATFYIQAHYLIDAIAGLLSGVVFYFALWAVYSFFPD